jgi:hypothetical protein
MTTVAAVRATATTAWPRPYGYCVRTPRQPSTTDGHQTLTARGAAVATAGHNTHDRTLSLSSSQPAVVLLRPPWPSCHLGATAATMAGRPS